MNVIAFITVAAAVLLRVIQAHHCGAFSYHRDLIVGGREVVNPAHWPWIVGLFIQEAGKTTFKCGATLVSTHVVVTAAHCMFECKNGACYPSEGEEILLVLGRTKIQNWQQQDTVQIRYAQNIVVHPSYAYSKIDGTDLAFIELSTPITITETVLPVCLWDDEEDFKLTASWGMVVGWGYDGTVGMTENPRKIKLPIVEKPTCLANIANPDFYNIASKNFTYCAGKKDGKGPCNGDSGSGMFVRRTRPDGKKSWVLRGLVSRSDLKADGSGLCVLENYIVFTDMSKFNPWLKNTSCSFKHTKPFTELQQTKIGDRYYYIEQLQALTWHNAQKFCVKNGMQLASLETEEENKNVKDYLKKNIPSGGGWNLWIGGNDLLREGVYRWTTGESFTYTDWRSGQPNNLKVLGGDEDCVLLNVWDQNSHWWRDDPCTREFQFMCELEDTC